MIFTLSKSEDVQIDICTNTDKKILDRVERIINSGSSLLDYSPDNDEEQSHTLFSDIYSYLSTSILGVLFGYVFKGIYNGAKSYATTREYCCQICCEDYSPKAYYCRSCYPTTCCELCHNGLWCPVFFSEVFMWTFISFLIVAFCVWFCH